VKRHFADIVKNEPFLITIWLFNIAMENHLLRTVNHLFLWAIYTMAMWNIQMVHEFTTSSEFCWGINHITMENHLYFPIDHRCSMVFPRFSHRFSQDHPSFGHIRISEAACDNHLGVETIGRVWICNILEWWYGDTYIYICLYHLISQKCWFKMV